MNSDVNFDEGSDYLLEEIEEYWLNQNTSDKTRHISKTRPDYHRQSVNALLELGIIISVATLMAAIYLLIIGVEQCYHGLVQKYRRILGRRPIETRNAAELVGTFKRYKNNYT